MRYRFYQWGWLLIDYVFPPRCGGCGMSGTRWCSECEKNIVLIEPPFCLCCGQKTSENEICHRCRLSPPSYYETRSLSEFSGPIRNALHRLKYRKDAGLGDVLSRKLVDYLQSKEWSIDMVVPVPLGKKRQKERGYNQSALLARPLAYAMGLAYNPQVLKRLRDTRSQVGLTLDQRQENVSYAFSAGSEEIIGKNILIVDDVTTSGATLKACSDALSSAGANQIFGLTLAQAVLSSA